MKKILIIAAALFLGAGIASAAENATDKNLKVIDLNFVEGKKFVWPFSSPSIKDLGTTVDPTKNSLGTKLLGKEVKYVYGSEVFTIEASKYVLQNPRLGFRLGGKITIKLPVIKGMSLASVSMTSANASYFGRAFLSDEDCAKPVPGGAALKKSTSDLKWVLADPQAGKQYCIVVTSPKSGIDFKNLTLIYAKKHVPTAYSVTTAKAVDGDGTFETLKGSFTALFADADDFSCGFEYKLNSEKKWTSITCDRPTAKFSQKVTGLKIDKNYVYRSWVCAPKSKKKVYGEEMTFSTAEAVYNINFSNEAAIKGIPYTRGAKEKNGNKISSHNFGTDASFKFWSEHGIAIATNGGKPFALAINPSKEVNGEFEFGGIGNAWIKFPGMEGKKLTKIEIVFYDVAPGSFNLSTEVNEGIGNKDIAETFKVTKGEKEFSFDVELEKGQACYLCAEKATRAFIKSISLTYSFR